MSRSGYSDDCEGSDLAMWRGIIASATRGKRGQRFFVDLVAALDAMPVKRLIADDLETEEGEVCSLGALARHRRFDGTAMAELDDIVGDQDYGSIGQRFDIAEQLAQEVMYKNDEAGPVKWEGRRRVEETPEQRWTRIRTWADKQIRKKLAP